MDTPADGSTLNFGISVTDAAAQTTTPVMFDVQVNHVNDTPVVTLAAQSPNFVEVVGNDDGSSAVVVNSDISLTDLDSTPVSAMVEITSGYEAEDELFIPKSYSGFYHHT